ncbi:transglycosylase SLT domain-containing protein [Nocardia cyriacigeorgica]|uniref:transglycosylase SLT domain-containing protein n=1 Tax=Nocardia cyriacigeorgica TaxID=135487 RepID=UPI00245707A5|nr:DUF4226 domain-containing protein [Nocardia cyriacigeorgica]
MTSAEVSPVPAESEAEEHAATENSPHVPSPWAPKGERQQGRAPTAPPGAQSDGATPAPQGATVSPGQSGPPAAVPAPATSAPAATWFGPGMPPIPLHAVPGTPVGTDPATTAPGPPPEPPPEHREEPPPGGIDPDMIGDALPVAATAGVMALGALPMIASALSGLLGGGGSGAPAGAQQGGGAPGSATGTSATPGGEAGTSGHVGLSPEAERALKTLKTLAAVYGEGETKDPQVKALRERWGVRPNGTSSGATATAVRAKQMFQRNAARAFNNLDNNLAAYIMRLAGTNKVDKKAVTSLLREVNVALAELGPQAYTRAGQKKVHQILTAALQKAHGIVSGGQMSATETAAAINRLTNQYLHNLTGRQVNMGTSGTGAVQPGGRIPGGTVGQWIQQAMEVLRRMGYDISKIDPEAIAIIIKHESNGNPNAHNGWDSNAAKGTPSKGLMQTIGPTFNRWAAPGYNNIYGPVDNIVAGVRYAINRYGSVSNVPGVVAVRSGRRYVGY